ncbi:MAG: M15 family metallopeptidase [Oscillospiraceae bacterium]|nr:M15 family metallopeptidase [Oscillospiraceae bacterium]
MYFKRTALCLLAIICILSIPHMALANVYDLDDEQVGYNTHGETPQHMSLDYFLYNTGLSFWEYIELMTELFSMGEYLHYLPENSSRYAAFSELHPEIPFGAIVAYVNVNVDLGEFNYIEPVPDPYFVGALVNKNFILPSGWTPSDLLTIQGGHMLREEAAEQFNEMREAMREEGLPLQIMSTFRSYERQRYNHARGVRRFGQESADRNFARPGHSEHQAGLAADVLHRGGFDTLTSARFYTTDSFAWLEENAHNFGFILRYPFGYMHIHGFVYEPWHWRFVGIDIATAMYEQGIVVYEEFYGSFLESNVLKAVQRYLQNLIEYEYAVAVAAAAAEAEAAAEPPPAPEEPGELYILEPDLPVAPAISEVIYIEYETTNRESITELVLLILFSIAIITAIVCIVIVIIKYRNKKPE